jgi:hypothetical protein
LQIGETGSQPRASAFFKLSNSVCRCSECPVSAHYGFLFASGSAAYYEAVYLAESQLYCAR